MTIKSSRLLAAVLSVMPAVSLAHTNTVGFQVQPSAATSCVGGAGTQCFDVEVFFGSWHSGTLSAEGDLAIFHQTGGGEVQVIGQSASGGSQVPFSTSHSLTGVIPNSGATTYNYSVVPSADYTNLSNAFELGTNYFFNNAGDVLGATPDGSTLNLYSHQSAVAVGLGPGTYRIDYDSATVGGLSATWTPVPSVRTATFTVTSDGGVVVDTGAAPNVSLSASAGPHTGPFTVTATFSEDVTGMDLSDFVVTNGSASDLVQVSPSIYTITVTPNPGATSVSIDLPEDSVIDSDTNGNTASNSLDVTITLPPGLNDQQRDEIVQTIVQEEKKTLRSQLSRNNKMMRRARGRFLDAMQCRRQDDGELDPRLELECSEAVQRNVPLDITGTAMVSQNRSDLSGSFFERIEAFDGSSRRLVFGEFEVTDYSELGLVATLYGRVAWEQMAREDLMLGYFLGGEVSKSDVGGIYSGDRERLGVSAGAYFVKELEADLTADGFVSVGLGRNELDMTDGVVAVESEYTTRHIQVGAALTGRKEFKGYVLYPEIALSHGYTDVGNASIDATSVGFDTSEALDVGHVSLTTLSFTPEVAVPLELDQAGFENSELRVRPRLSCERVEAGTASSDCGGGLGVEISATSEDGMRRFTASAQAEKVGTSQRNGIALSFEMDF